MTNQHAGPPRESGEPSVPEPSYAERARTLLYLGRTGTLATLSGKHPGHPFASIMPYAPDEEGNPVFLISTMAMHTQNLKKDPRASLLVTQPGWEGDPLAGGRVTLMGNVETLPEREGSARENYLARHPNASYWVDFDDFAFYKLSVMDVYFVGGFAAMGWIPAEEHRISSPDPLADAAEGIIKHMNEDHADALIVLAKVLGEFDADEAQLTSVDRLGFKLRMKNRERMRGIRIPFLREARSAEDVRSVFIEMLGAARSKAGR